MLLRRAACLLPRAAAGAAIISPFALSLSPGSDHSLCESGGHILTKDTKNELRNLYGETFLQLLLRGERRSFEPGESIFNIGDRAKYLYLVLSGEVEWEQKGVLEGEAQALDVLPKGSVFGDIALLMQRERRSRALFSKTDTEVIALKKEVVEAALQKMNPKLKDEPSVDARILTFIEMVSPSTSLQLKAGDTVFKQGQVSEPCFYIIKNGALKVTQKPKGGSEIEVGELAEGECFGYVSLMAEHPSKPKSFTITATDTCNILKVNGKDFHRLLDHSKVVSNFISERMRERQFMSSISKAQEETVNF